MSQVVKRADSGRFRIVERPITGNCRRRSDVLSCPAATPSKVAFDELAPRSEDCFDGGRLAAYFEAKGALSARIPERKPSPSAASPRTPPERRAGGMGPVQSPSLFTAYSACFIVYWSPAEEVNCRMRPSRDIGMMS